jgi:serine/threonine protein kinase
VRADEICWTVKPHVVHEAAAERFRTIAQELTAAAHQGGASQAEAHVSAARQFATETFLDPHVARSIDADLTQARPLLSAAQDASTAIQQVATRMLPPSADSVSDGWPRTITGGERVLHFRLVRALREGGMGDVFLAWDERLDRNVVLKRLGADQDRVEGYQRLEREARAAARIQHPNVVTIYALEYFGDEPILVQEYIEGADLDALSGTLPFSEILRIAVAVADALAVTHAQGIIHRDLKPRNVRVRPGGIPVVLDFGLGKTVLVAPEAVTQVALTRPGMAIGTPYYMAPEQWTGRAITAAADVFSFGVLLFELLTGHTPFHDAENRTAIYAAILQGKVPRLERDDVPRLIEELIHACLLVDARERPTMRAVLDRLNSVAAVVAAPMLPPIERDAAVTEQHARNAWSSGQAKHARTIMGSTAVTFEAFLTFNGNAPNASLEQLEALLRPLARDDLRIGQFEATGTRCSEEISSVIKGDEGDAYWAARGNGDLIYLAIVPPLATGAIPMKLLLRNAADVLGYIARYASVLSPEGLAARLLIEFELSNVGDRLIGTADWSPRLTTTLTQLRKQPRRQLIRASMVASVQSLRTEFRDVLKLLFDDLMRHFAFVAVPDAFYDEFSES